MSSSKKISTKKLPNIMIVGCGGSGKSTVAMEFAKITGLRVIHLDHIYWQSGWVLRKQEEINALISNEMNEDGWICEGNNASSFHLRVPHASMIIWLDVPRYLCVWRVLKRIVKYSGKQRPDLPDGCHDRFNWEFLKWVWNFNKNSRPKIQRLIEETEGSLEQVILKSPQEVRSFLDRLKTGEYSLYP